MRSSTSKSTFIGKKIRFYSKRLLRLILAMMMKGIMAIIRAKNVMSLFLEELVAHGEERDGEAGTEEDDEIEGQLVPVVDREGKVVARSWEAITTASGNGGGEVPDGGAGEPGDGGGEHLLQPLVEVNQAIKA